MRQCASGLPHIESYLINGRAALERELRLFQSILGDETLERDRFLWARFVTFSRTFTVPRLRLSADEALREGLRPDVATFGASGGEAAVLVPLADMINHAPASAVNCRWRYAGAEAGFTVATKRPLAAGEELLLSYGSKENKLFLAHYGFVAAGSPSDTLELELQLPPPREATATSEEQQPGGERLRLSISGSQAAEVETLQEILEACRAAARRRHAAAALSEEELEAAAFRLLLAELAREAEPLRPSGACPAVCAGLRGNLLALLGTWGHFAERALALLPAGSEGAAADSGDGQESWGTLVGPYLLHARLYFGLWLRTYGRRLVDEVVVGWEVMAEASEFGRVSYVDLAPELDIDVEGG